MLTLSIDMNPISTSFHFMSKSTFILLFHVIKKNLFSLFSLSFSLISFKKGQGLVSKFKHVKISQYIFTVRSQNHSKNMYIR